MNLVRGVHGRMKAWVFLAGELVMSFRAVVILLVTSIITQSASGQEKYTIHENLHVHQTLSYVVNYDYKVKTIETTNGHSDTTDHEIRQEWKVAMTILAIKDGSSTWAKVDVDPSSVDIHTAEGNEKRTPCAFAGKSIFLTRAANESVTDSFLGDADSADTDLLKSFINPDELFFPNGAVAVGDTWDNSAKLARRTDLGPSDKLRSSCHLDWVKAIDGRQIGQVTNSQSTMTQETGNSKITEEGSSKITFLVDIAVGVIVKCDEHGSSKYTSPPTESTQVTGGTESIFHSEVLPGKTPAATQP